MHLFTQRAVHVSDVDAALDEALRGLDREPVLLMFGNRQVQSALDGLSLSLRLQKFLSALDLPCVQLKVLVRAISCRGHRKASNAISGYHCMYIISIFMYIHDAVRHLPVH